MVLRAPKQERSRQTLEAVLSAAEALIEEHGFDTVTLVGIVDAAGTSIGAFYKRFSGKDALLDALFDRFAESGRRRHVRFLESADGAEPAEIVRGFVKTQVSFYAERGQLIHALMQRASSHMDHRERAARMLRASSEGLTSALSAATARSGRAWERQVDFAVRQLFAVLDQRVEFGSIAPTRFRLSTKALIAAATKSMLVNLDLHEDAS
jgi:AcrR family transcriptional regulator